MKKPKTGNPQLENGYTKIVDELLEEIISNRKLLTEKGQVFFAVLRLTYGWGEKKAKISNKQIQELTGLNAPNTSRTKKALIKAKVITCDNNSKKNPEIGINKRYKEWELSPVIKKGVITHDNKKLSPMIRKVITDDNSSIYIETIDITETEKPKTSELKPIFEIEKQEITDIIISTLDKATFEKWIKHLEWAGKKSDVIFLASDNKKKLMWISENVLDKINVELKNILNKSIELLLIDKE